MAWAEKRERQKGAGRLISSSCRILLQAGWWWHTPLIPALGRQRQVDLCEFEASLVYKS